MPERLCIECGAILTGATHRCEPASAPGARVRQADSAPSLASTHVARDLSLFGPGLVRSPEPGAVPDVGPYRDCRQIGEGGMGAILEAVDPKFDRPVAVKILKVGTGSDPFLVRKFVQKARITAQLEHPNIVPVHDAGVSGDGARYFTMKLVEGESLQCLLDAIRKGSRQRDAYPRSRMLADFLKICDAVAFAHSKGVIHPGHPSCA